jgi:hypothetical protein
MIARMIYRVWFLAALAFCGVIAWGFLGYAGL